MKLSIREPEKDIRILDINGQVDASNATHLEEELDKLISAGRDRIVVNFKEVNYISSAGLRVFLSALKKMQLRNGRMLLCEMNSNVHRIFKLAGFTEIIGIHQTEAESISRLHQH